ncbi:transposase [Crocosphaera watsonii]|uniref:Transposase, IS4 n=1 Tax=Crocosphaera watsonii WH 0401 TaxID=555881 RepID=T2JG24_CROWT|nr:transposase [Crocosphaera watsonii]CCQ63402.1 Transposase, IS4 [Crocosphaera watsonii WH 0401]
MKQKVKNKSYSSLFVRNKVQTRKKDDEDYQTFSQLGMKPGMKMFLTGVSVTKNKGFGNFNVGAYWKRKYKGKQEKEPWFILTNLDSLSEVLKVYRARAGIEAMFKDCKTGGYNWEGSKANNKRLNSLILLIADRLHCYFFKRQNISTNQSRKIYCSSN